MSWRGTPNGSPRPRILEYEPLSRPATRARLGGMLVAYAGLDMMRHWAEGLDGLVVDATAARDTRRVYDFDGVLGPEITQFVQRHVRTLLTWDILVFFERNSTAVIDAQGLASRLGRRVEDIRPEIDPLCDGDILECSGGLIRYEPSPDMQRNVTEFVSACQDKGRRLALIALVLHNITPRSRGLQQSN